MERAWAAWAMLATLGLAGCVSGEAVEPLDAEAPVVVTDPREHPANDTEGAAHVHDDWRGKTRLPLVDDGFGGFQVYYRPFVLAFEPPDGSFVPQGADAVHVSVSWTGTVQGDPELWVKTAAIREPARVGLVENGIGIILPVTPDAADIPHQRVSTWRFEVRLPLNERPAGLFSGNVALVAEARRGDEPLPILPPYGDLWHGASEIKLVEGSFQTPVQATAPFFTICDPEACFPTHVPEEGVVVPYDAAEVVVTLEREPGSVGEIALRYRSASTRSMSPIEPESVEGERLTYRIAVGRAGDSPYAKESLWAFQVHVPGEPEPVDAFHGGYAIEATARRAPTQP